jgi:uncharacterized protein (TIRG00374 family)
MSTSSRRWPRLIFRVSLHVLGFGLLANVLWSNRSAFGEVLKHKPEPAYLAISILFFLISRILNFARWWVIVVAQGLDLRFRDAMKIGFIGHAFDQVIPGQVGGEVYKASFLCKGQEKRTRAIASVLIDRAIGIVGLFTLVAVMGVFLWPASSGALHSLLKVVWAGWFVGTLGLTTVFMPALIRPIQRLVARSERLSSVAFELHEMSTIYSDRKLPVMLAVAMAVASHVAVSCSFLMVSAALLPEPPTLFQHLLMVPLIILSSMLPLPFSALGFSEQVSEELFRMLGHPAGALAMLGFRLVGLSVTGVSVVYYILHSRETARERAEISA